MKLAAVLDTSVVISALGWRGEARTVLRLLARRCFTSVRSPYLTREWTETLTQMSAEYTWPNPNWPSWLEWLKAKSRLVEDGPLKRIVRDPKDDPILGLAIAERVPFLVSYDGDLLDLERPYGVQCVAPRRFIGPVLSSL
jgi:putative PIN family toxin of toxin-antitoxin system